MPPYPPLAYLPDRRFSLPRYPSVLLLLTLLLVLQPARTLASEQNYRLVFGSFKIEENARGWAAHVQSLLHRPVMVMPVQAADIAFYRVVSEPLAKESLARLMLNARQRELNYWRLADLNLITQDKPAAEVDDGPGSARTDSVTEVVEGAHGKEPGSVPAGVSTAAVEPAYPAQRTTDRSGFRNASADAPGELDTDLALQSRGFARSGSHGQSSLDASISLQPEYHRAFASGTDSMTFSAFLRYDSEDERRSHWDLRELYWNHTGADWEIRAGVQQVFWGVTEFRHLVDIINQTDLVEDIDEEDKLGQPLINLSLVRDWGILDLFLLTGFRERTFPGEEGRFRYPLPISEGRTTYASGAGERRIDAAIRWTQVFGALELGVYQFSGTNRDPQLKPLQLSDGRWVLQPHYTVIDQTGIDAQYILGDWAFKLEALRRTGDGDPYMAFVAGFEKTQVGIFGSRSDLGLVAEYMYDERGDAAPNLYEHDLALGTRWRLNDISDSQALLGVIWDVQTHEAIYSLEASRQIGDSWKLLLESRIFAGAESPRWNSDLERLASLVDTENKSTPLQRDDYIQLELTRFF